MTNATARPDVRLLGCLMVSMALLGAAAARAGAGPALMPEPMSVSMASGSLPLTGVLLPDWSGCRSAALDRAVARLQADIDRLTGVRSGRDGPVPLSITCETAGGAIVPDRNEGYRLRVGADGVRVAADGAAGVLRAFATLRQLVTLHGPPALAFATIDDAPRFEWRGVLLDPARHFIEVPTLERQIDAMERVKLNVLHLHLSDNEAFRVESRRYPRLTMSAGGRFYTRAEIRGLVAYASDRGVRIVPEIDVPGHSRAIVQAYPEIGIQVPSPLGPAFPVDAALNPALGQTYRFLDRLIVELTTLFPGPYLHIGGDEVAEAVWAGNADVKALMAREQLDSVRQVQGYFERRVIALVRAAGRTAIGWEEVAAGDVPKDVVIQAWRTSNATAAVTAKGHRTIVSAGYYLDLLMPADFHYALDPLDPSAAGFTPEAAARARAQHPRIAPFLTDALVARPLPPLTREQAALVIGGEAPLWGELVTDEMVGHRLWPRAAALAERFWSPAGVRDPEDMYRRLAAVNDRLAVTGLGGEASRHRMALRLAPGAAGPVHALLDIVTPVRNMAHDHRILAALRGQRVVQPLTALADAAPADSLLAHRFAARARRLVAGEHALEPGLRAQLEIWRSNHGRFAALARGNPRLEPALPTSRTIAELAGIGIAALDAIAAGQSLDQATANRARSLIAALEAQQAASWTPLLSFLNPQPPADLIIAITPGVRALVGAAGDSRSGDRSHR